MKVGVIGLGEVSQLMHLPILQDLSDKFTVQAISDVSPSLVAYVAEKYHIPETYLDAEELIAKADIELVLILSPDQYHGAHIKAALKRGIHAFVEKPPALDPAELRELMELEKKHPEQIVMVGYMRRYSSGFLKMQEIMKDGGAPQYARFRDLIQEAPFYIRQTRAPYYPEDVPQAVIREGAARRRAHLDAAIGADASDDQRTTYQMMTGLGVHSFSAMRELFGMPREILSVATAANGQHVVLVMQFDGFLGIYELVNNLDVVHFDASFEVLQQSRKLHLKFETPYLRYQPTTLQVVESDQNETKTINYGPDYRDPFRLELEELYDCIKTKRRPKTVLADAVEDLEFFRKMMQIVKERAK